jgi:hypothetical protein
MALTPPRGILRNSTSTCYADLTPDPAQFALTINPADLLGCSIATQGRIHYLDSQTTDRLLSVKTGAAITCTRLWDGPARSPGRAAMASPALIDAIRCEASCAQTWAAWGQSTT